MGRVVLHIGAPKAGSTYLQVAMARNRGRLRAQGVLYPGSRRNHFGAAIAQLDRPVGLEDDAPAPEDWDVLAAAAREFPGTAVLSAEQLCWATQEQAQRVVAGLGEHVELVYVLRDFARLVPSSYQESVKHRRRHTFAEFLEAISSHSDDYTGNFWQGQDAGAVLRRWGAVVPVERTHVITVPRSRGPLLLQRFADVVGFDPAALAAVPEAVNPSLMRTETEVLRRLNEQSFAGMSRRRYRRFVRDAMAVRVLPGRRRDPTRDRPLALDQRWQGWAREQAAGIVAGVRASGARVHGDLAELVPADGPVDGDVRPPSPEDVYPAALDAIAGYVLLRRDLMAASWLRLAGGVVSRSPARSAVATVQRALRPVLGASKSPTPVPAGPPPSAAAADVRREVDARLAGKLSPKAYERHVDGPLARALSAGDADGDSADGAVFAPSVEGRLDAAIAGLRAYIEDTAEAVVEAERGSRRNKP